MAQTSSFETVQRELNDQVKGLQVSIENLEGQWISFQQVLERSPIEKPELSALIDELTSNWKQEMQAIHKNAISKSQQIFDHHTDSTTQTIKELIQKIQKEADSIDKTYNEYKDGFKEAQETIKESEEDWLELHEKISSFMEDLDSRLEDLEQENNRLHKDVTKRIDNNIKEPLQEDHEAWSKSLTKISKAIVTSHESTQKDSGAFNEHTSSTLDTINDEISERMEELLEAVIKHLQTEVAKRLEEVFEYLVKETAEALLAELAENIIKTQIGATVTASLSPIIPQLIILNKATEIIKEAIAIFKKMEELIS
jgi:hypothetical protein